MLPLIDTHCHLDAAEFDGDRDDVIRRARNAGVSSFILPAIDVNSFEKVRNLAHQLDGGAYAVGIHPMFVRHSEDQDLLRLREFVEQHINDEKLVAIGEIGLDFFVPDISRGVQRTRQIDFYRCQLEMAKAFGLPVLLHVRRSQDELLKWLRRIGSTGGIAHAFNGSDQQAQQFVDLGFALGIGGAMTYTRARQIRRLAMSLPLANLVLETDSPDIAPAWLVKGDRNDPSQLAQIARCLAQLRDADVTTVVDACAQTAVRVLPRLADLLKFPVH